MKINKKQFNKWLNALYAEKYPKGKHRLQNEYGYCCLGAGCMELVPKTELNRGGGGMLLGYRADEQSKSPKWLKEINDDFNALTLESLTDLNDGRTKLGEFSHPEIAMLLDLVYNYKILD